MEGIGLSYQGMATEMIRGILVVKLRLCAYGLLILVSSSYDNVKPNAQVHNLLQVTVAI